MEKIFAYVDEHFEEMIEELKELTSFRSVAGDKEGLENTRDWIEKKFAKTGIACERHNVPGGNAILTAHVPSGEGGKDTALLFYNHYDVVEEGKHELWRNDPFAPQVRDGILYGRGVSDNKGPLLSRIQAIQAILAVKGSLPVGVKFFFEGDEETSSPSLKAFSRTQPELFRDLTQAQICLWENGRRDENGRPWARFGVRGSVSFTLSVELAKKDVHARMGSIVPSASWRLVKALSTLMDDEGNVTIDGFYDDIRPITPADIEALNAFPYEQDELQRNLGIKAFVKNATGLQLKRQLYMEPSVSISGLEAGELYNGPRAIVPHKALARVSCYLVADQTPDAVERQLRGHLERRGFTDIQIQRRGSNTPVRTPLDIPFRDIVIRSAAQAYKEPMIIEPTQLGGGPAICFHQAWPDMPIVGVGPGNTNGNHHAPDENMILEDYKASIKHMIALLYEMAK